MAEDWLYDLTFKHIGIMHTLNLQKLLSFRGKIILDSASLGTKQIQIDIVAADTTKRVIVLAECKEFLSFQSASECAEQLFLKTFLLRNRFAGSLGRGIKAIEHSNLHKYRLLQYVSLGSYPGTKYRNAKCSSAAELHLRMYGYAQYLRTIQRRHIGLLLFLDMATPPIASRAAIMSW